MMAKVNLLVVDDATFIRDLIKNTLRKTFPNIECQEAIDGKKAQTILKKGNTDLILCDWEMPEMNGEELLKWVRAEEKLRDTPFVMVTSRGEKAHLVNAVQSGVSDYLTKPFNNEMLIKKVMKALKKIDKLKDAKAETRPAQVTGGSFAADSVSLLTGGGPPSGSAAPKAEKKPEPKKQKNKAIGQGQLRFSDFAIDLIITELSFKYICGIVKRNDEQLPKILQQAVVDLAQKDDPENVARINGFIEQIECTEKKIDTRFLSVTFHIVDDDPDKINFLTNFSRNS